MVGRIVEVGPRVNTLVAGLGYREGEELSDEYHGFQPGERVTVQSRAARYASGLMLMSEPVTILSFYINGAYSQYMRIDSDLIRTGSVIRVPEPISDEAAALAEPAACALESIFCTPHPIGVDAGGRHQYRAGILPGGRCCVIGSGTVSMIYARLARLEEAAQVVMLVRSEKKASLVQQVLGDEVSVEVVGRYSELPLPEKMEAEEAIVERMREITEGHLFDDVISACADPDAQRLMLKLYSPQGYAVGACFGGTHALVDGADIDTNHYRMAKTIGSSGCSTRTLEAVVRWLAEGGLSLDGFIDSRRYRFDDRPEEFFGPAERGLKPALDPWK
jgi:L-iditol 2-dehydrogenase